jgi:hypothetical protein
VKRRQGQQVYKDHKEPKVHLVQLEFKVMQDHKDQQVRKDQQVDKDQQDLKVIKDL